jgi:hypothetical protein
MVDEPGKYYIYDVPKGSAKNKRKYFATYADAAKYIRRNHPPDDDKCMGIFHIYPVDNSGYASPSNGRKSFGAGNKDWEKNQKNRRRVNGR